MVDFQNRKKVYILCGKEEYATVWEHLHEIINVQEEELIVPYNFMEYEKIDEKIENSIAISLSEGYRKESEIRTQKINDWYEKKFIHFKVFAPMANKVIITKNIELSELDSKEKEKEIAYCTNIPFKAIKTVDMKELTHQKTIK